MKSQKIAVIGVKGLPAQQGGIERYCQEVYPRMAAQGYKVDLFARSTYNNSQSWLSYYQGVKVIALPSVPLRGVDALINSLWAMLIAILGNYDVIHVHALGPALWCWVGKFFSRSKIVVTCHGLDWQRAKWGKLSSRLIRLGEQIAVKCADEIIVVARNLKRYFKETYNRDTSYIPTAPSSHEEYDPEFPYLRSLSLEPKKYMLFLGRLVPEKRPDLLIQAFQQLKPDGWQLVLAGGQSDTEDYFLKLKEQSKNNPNICFTGEIKGEVLAEVLNGAGLFVLPSALEGLPLVMLEAMEARIPVVASNIAPHRQLIGSDRGFLFKQGNLESCVDCLATAIASPERLQEMSKNAKLYLENHHSWQGIVMSHQELYQSPRKLPRKLAISNTMNALLKS